MGKVGERGAATAFALLFEGARASRSHANFVRAILLLAGMLGCGGGATSSPMGTHVTWTADGVAFSGVGGKAIFSSDGTSDSLEILGVTTEAGFSIAITTPTPFVPATFKCNQAGAGPTIFFSYSMGDAPADLKPQSCTVVVSQLGKATGDPVAGTFEATVAKQGGGTMALTNGSFELPLSM